MCMSARQTANEMEKGASYGKPDMTQTLYAICKLACKP